MRGNRISVALSLSPLGDLRKSVSKLKSPAVMDMIFNIVLAVEENGDLYRRLKQQCQTYDPCIYCTHMEKEIAQSKINANVIHAI